MKYENRKQIRLDFLFLQYHKRNICPISGIKKKRIVSIKPSFHVGTRFANKKREGIHFINCRCNQKRVSL